MQFRIVTDMLICISYLNELLSGWSLDLSTESTHALRRCMLIKDHRFDYQGKVIAMFCAGTTVILVGASWAIWRFWQWEYGGSSFWRLGTGAGEI